MPATIDTHSRTPAIAVHCDRCSLQRVCLPRELAQDALRCFDDEVERPAPIERGAALFEAGARVDFLFAVRSGSVRTLVLTSDGSEQTTGFYLPGEIVGLDGIAGGSHAVTAIALERTTVCRLPLGNMSELFDTVPGLAQEMLRLAGEAIACDQRRFLLLGQMTAEARVASFLLDFGERLNRRGLSALRFCMPMSRHELANYLGLAVETVSRLFSRLREQGVLEVDRREIEILDSAALHTLVGDTEFVGMAQDRKAANA